MIDAGRKGLGGTARNGHGQAQTQGRDYGWLFVGLHNFSIRCIVTDFEVKVGRQVETEKGDQTGTEGKEKSNKGTRGGIARGPQESVISHVAWQ